MSASCNKYYRQHKLSAVIGGGTAHALAGCVAVMITILGPAPVATAQAQNSNLPLTSECLQSRSRVQQDCEPKETVIKAETEISVSVEAPAPKTVHCSTAIEVEYSQHDTLAHVEGVIENHDCAASNGEYRLAIVIRGAEPEPKTLEFVESWQRQDDQPVMFKADYPIGANVDLIRVRSRQLRCTCTEIPGADYWGSSAR